MVEVQRFDSSGRNVDKQAKLRKERANLAFAERDRKNAVEQYNKATSEAEKVKWAGEGQKAVRRATRAKGQITRLENEINKEGL